VGDAVDAAVLVVAVRVAEVVLEVADDGLGPIAEVDGAVRAVADADGAEGFGVALDEIGETSAFDAGVLVFEFGAVDALEADDIEVEEIALPIVGEVA
jgi:hypothetical protein